MDYSVSCVLISCESTNLLQLLVNPAMFSAHTSSLITYSFLQCSDTVGWVTFSRPVNKASPVGPGTP